MASNISLITIGVADVAKATAFYERLGFVRSKTPSEASISFFRAGPLVLALWGRDDALAGTIWTGNGGIVVSQNVASGQDVDAWRARAKPAGAHTLKAAAKTFWGGYNGYFADQDGPFVGDRLQSLLETR